MGRGFGSTQTSLQVCGSSVILACAQDVLSDSDDRAKSIYRALQGQIAKRSLPKTPDSPLNLDSPGLKQVQQAIG